MKLGVRFILPLAAKGPVNLPRWDAVLLDEPVRHHGDVLVEEVEHLIVHPLESYSQFVDAVPQQVCFRSPELMTELGQAAEGYGSLVLGFVWQSVEPLQERHRTVRFLVQDDPCPWHPSTPDVL